MLRILDYYGSTMQFLLLKINRETFSNYAQVSTKNENDEEILENKIKNLELNDKVHFSSNSLHNIVPRGISHVNTSNHQMQSSQSLNDWSNLSGYIKPWERQSVNNMNIQIDVSEFSSETSSFTPICGNQTLQVLSSSCSICVTNNCPVSVWIHL